ncbi:MAG: murein biosynthesis integral membrane protein MurJ [Paracoccaceae bacterium]
MNPKPIRLLPAFLTVGGWTLASRVLGFVRDMMIAAFLGTGPVAEAFLVAFSLPNMFRRFFAEGAFNMAFVPMFSKKVEAGEDARAFAQDALSGLASLLIVLTLIAQIFMPWMILALAGGFSGDDRLELAAHFGRVTFPYLLFISLAALLGGVLNALGRFAVAAGAPVLLNIILIAAISLAAAADWDFGEALVWGVAAAGVAQFAVVWIAAGRAGMRLPLVRPRLTPELKKLARIAAPAALGAGVVQVNLLIGRQIASFFDGAIAWLNYADRLYQLPLGVAGIAIGIVLLPDLSRRLRAGDEVGGRHAFNRGAEFAMALSLPAAVALVVIPQPLVSVLFERGAFNAADSRATAAVVAIYGLGLPAFMLQKVLSPLYFARADTTSPFRFAVISMVVNIILAVGLAPVIGYLASAVGTTMAGWSMVALLSRGARPMGMAARFDDRLKRALPRIAVSSVAMGACLWVSAIWLHDMLAAPGIRYIALAMLIAVGFSVYTGLALATGGIDRKLVRSTLSRQR